MNIDAKTGLGRYNKATAAAVSQALVQLVAAFVPFPPELEQAIGIVLTSVLVYLVPNKVDGGSAASPMPVNGEPLIAHLPFPAMAAAVAVSVLLAGCVGSASGDAVADRLLGADCGPASRAFRAQALTDSVKRAYPEISTVGMRLAADRMVDAAASGRSIEAAAAGFQVAISAAMAPVLIEAGFGGQPVLAHLLRLPPVAAELLRIQSEVAAYCVAT